MLQTQIANKTITLREDVDADLHYSDVDSNFKFLQLFGASAYSFLNVEEDTNDNGFSSIIFEFPFPLDTVGSCVAEIEYTKNAGASLFDVHSVSSTLGIVDGRGGKSFQETGSNDDFKYVHTLNEDGEQVLRCSYITSDSFSKETDYLFKLTLKGYTYSFAKTFTPTLVFASATEEG